MSDPITNRIPDLTVATAGLALASLDQGEGLTLAYTVANTGDGDALASQTFFFVDGNYRESASIGPVDAAGSVSTSHVLDTAGLSAGRHYLEVFADGANAVVESDEGNNWYESTAGRRLYFDVVVRQPDLTVSDASIDAATVDQGARFDLSYTVSNGGDAVADISLAHVYLDGSYLGFGQIDPLAAGQSAATVFSVNTEGLAPGSHSLEVFADGTNLVAESDEANNWYQTGSGSEIFFDVVVRVPDLIVTTAGVAAATIDQGDEIKLGFQVQNIGDALAGETFAYVYLDDEFLQYTYTGALGAGDRWDENFSINAASLSAGEHYFEVYADGDNRVAESNEANNWYRSGEKQRIFFDVVERDPDLIVAQADLSQNSVFQGEQVTLNYKVGNIGERSAGGSFTYVLLDGQLKRSNLIPLLDISASADGSYGIDTSGLSVGRHYVDVVADGTGTLVESNEENNTFRTESGERLYFDVRLRSPDLTVTSAALGSASIDRGATLTVNYTAENIGTGVAGNSWSYLYLDGSYLADGDDFVASLAAGGASNQTIDIDTNDLSAGQHYIELFVDGTRAVAESNEANNWYQSAAGRKLYFDVVVRAPDLTISSASLNDDNVDLGDDIVLDYRVENIGNQSTWVGSRVYIFRDGEYQDYKYFLPLEAGQATGGQYVFDTAGLALGRHDFEIIADGGGVVPEANEANNWYRSGDRQKLSFHVLPKQPDLTIADVQIDGGGSVIAGENLSLSYRTYNNGSADAGTPLELANFDNRIYLSIDSELSADDLLLQADRIKWVSAGSYDPQSNTFKIPSSVEAGSYYLLFQADVEDRVEERDESNNVTRAQLSVRELPKISIADATGEEGQSLSFRVSLDHAEPERTVTVDYNTSAGTASESGEAVDYVGIDVDRTLSFAPGETVKYISIDTNPDSLEEGLETFQVNLNDPTNASILDGEALGSIADPNRAPLVDTDRDLVVPGDAGVLSLGISGPRDPDGDPLTIQVSTTPDQGVVRIGAHDAVTAGQILAESELTSLTFTPVSGYVGDAGSFSYEVDDGNGGRADQTLAFAVTAATPPQPAPASDPGDSLGSAQQLEQLAQGTAVVDGAVGGVDKADWFRWESHGSSRLSLSLAGVTGRPSLTLMDDSGFRLARGRGSRQSLDRQLADGTYYISVKPYRGRETNYTLNIGVASDNPLFQFTEREGLAGADYLRVAASTTAFGGSGDDRLEPTSANTGVSVFVGGRGDDDYVARDGALILVADSDRWLPDEARPAVVTRGDQVIADGIDLSAAGAKAALIDDRHLYLGAGDDGQEVLVLDWKSQENGIERFQLANGSFTATELEGMLQTAAFFTTQDWGADPTGLGLTSGLVGDALDYYAKKSSLLHLDPAQLA